MIHDFETSLGHSRKICFGIFLGKLYLPPDIIIIFEHVDNLWGHGMNIAKYLS